MKLRPDTRQIDFEQTELYRSLLAPNETQFLLTAFDDDQDRNNPPNIFYGTLEENYPQLTAMNNQGYYPCISINETTGIFRKKEDIVNIRTVIIESDSGEYIDTPIQPNFVVESSPGKFHKYFLVTGMTVHQQMVLQKLLVDEYGSDPNAKDISRVLRLPGFYHQKKSERKGLTGEPWMVRIVEVNRRESYIADELMTAFGLPFMLEDLLTHSEEVAADVSNTARILAAVRNVIYDPEQHDLTDQLLKHATRVVNTSRLGLSQYRAGQSLDSVKTALESVNSGRLCEKTKHGALAAIDAFQEFVKTACPSKSLPATLNTGTDDVLDYLWSEDKLRDMHVALDLIDSEDRDVWVAIGYALKRVLGEAGFKVWDVWSSRAVNYEHSTMRKQWDSFAVDADDPDKGNIGFGTIYEYALQSLCALIDQAIVEVHV